MTLPVCPLCTPDGKPRRTVAEIGDPDGYCTVNAHRELAVQALELATWNGVMWAAALNPEQASSPETAEADRQEAML